MIPDNDYNGEPVARLRFRFNLNGDLLESWTKGDPDYIPRCPINWIFTDPQVIADAVENSLPVDFKRIRDKRRRSWLRRLWRWVRGY